MEWRGLGEFEPNELVQTRQGLAAVASVESLSDRAPLFNIEVDGEHVYEVTQLGVLVHNAGISCREYLGLKLLESKGALSEEQLARLAVLEKEILPSVKAAAAKAVPAWSTEQGQKLLAPKNSDLGRLALEYRADRNVSAARNVFVVEYETNGVRQTEVFVSREGVHSEVAALKELPEDAKVLRAYSERTPCTSGKNECYVKLLDDPRFSSMTELQYSYVWGSDEAATQKSILDSMAQYAKHK
jgi:hypothetical protein